MKKISKSDQILRLTEKWYTYVNLDHHKSRDCIWSIDISYEYGEAPKYHAYHHGYILDDWRSPYCDTLEDAQDWLINKLDRELEYAMIHLKEIVALEQNEEAQWIDPANRAPKILEELMK